MAAQSRGSVKVLVQPLNGSLLATAMALPVLAFGEDLEQQFGAAAVQREVAELVEAEQVDPAAAGDDLGQLAVVGGLGELVDQARGQHVADAVAGFSGGRAQRDEQVGLAGAAVADQAERRSGGDPAGGAELSEGGGVDVGVGGGVEVLEPLGSGEAGVGDAASAAAGVAVVALGQQQLGQNGG